MQSYPPTTAEAKAAGQIVEPLTEKEASEPP
jgi:hypothetical protein